MPAPGERRIGAALVFTGLALLTVLSVRTGTYFDDEIATIRLMEQAGSLRETIALANGGDVHPPLGYVLDWLLLRLTGSWKGVQLIAGIANAAALAGFAGLAARRLERRAWWILIGLSGTAASAVMWGASLRWYAWFNPVFLLCLGLVLWSGRGPRLRLWLAAGGSVLLFHTGYLAVIAAPLLGFAWALRLIRERRPIPWRAAAVACGAAVVVCLPQAWVLLHVHLANQSDQRGGLAISLIQTATTLLLGNAVQPLSVLAVLMTATMLAALVAVIRRQPRGILPLVGLAALGFALLVASGLGYKPRNAVFLALALLPAMAAGLAALPRWPRWAALALVALFQVRGYANVALHEGTAKRSFNTPYPLLVDQVAAWQHRCPALVVSHGDPVLGYLLGPGVRQSGPFAPAAQHLRNGDCLVVEDGNALELSPSGRAWIAARDGLPHRREAVATWRDETAFARAAGWLGKPVSPYAARLELRRLVRPARLAAYGASDTR